MSDLSVTASLPEALVGRLKELEEPPGVRVKRIPALTTPVTQREILDGPSTMCRGWSTATGTRRSGMSTRLVPSSGTTRWEPALTSSIPTTSVRSSTCRA